MLGDRSVAIISRVNCVFFPFAIFDGKKICCENAGKAFIGTTARRALKSYSRLFTWFRLYCVLCRIYVFLLIKFGGSLPSYWRAHLVAKFGHASCTSFAVLRGVSQMLGRTLTSSGPTRFRPRLWRMYRILKTDGFCVFCGPKVLICIWGDGGVTSEISSSKITGALSVTHPTHGMRQAADICFSPWNDEMLPRCLFVAQLFRSFWFVLMMRLNVYLRCNLPRKNDHTHRRVQMKPQHKWEQQHEACIAYANMYKKIS